MSRDDDPDRLLTLARVAAQLGVSRQQLRRASASGELRTYVIGKRWVRLRSGDVRAWLETRRRQAPPSGGSDGGATPGGDR